MNHPSKKTGRQIKNFPVWTYDQAERAVPYITSIMRSIRESYIDRQYHHRRAKRLAEKPGRPDRNSIIQHDEAKGEAQRLLDEVADAARELAELNIQCADPINGVAMVPFVQSEQLAWLVFNLFDDVKITSWRYHHDPLTARRPIEEIETEQLPKPMVV